MIWSVPHDHPVASATETPWGDEFYVAAPTADDPTATMREFMAYGAFPESEFHANAKLIAMAPDLAAEVLRLRAALEQTETKP